jgi:hypothetical protein
MTVFVSHHHGVVQVLIRAEGPTAIGDVVEIVKPGEGLFGHPYGWWAALPAGAHRISPRPVRTSD